ncbi:MAG: tetratricopeptide repeat protein [Anaerolineae bacterium]|nr:tetratricopeptide repeat protein [Anaerolineae bacterium]
MARALPPTSFTPADELRDLLDRSERRVVNLRGTGKDTVLLLDWLDRIAVLATQLEADGADLRPERARLGTVEAQLRDRARQLVREAGAEFPRARQEAEPTPDRWWWYVDEIAAEQRRQQLRRLGLMALGLAAVVVAIWFVFNVLFPVDPKVAAVQRLRGEADRALSTGDLVAALAAYEEAAQTDPEDPSLIIWVGVLQEGLGQQEVAEQKYREAEAMTDSRLLFLLERGRVYGSVGQLDKALADAEAVLVLDPDSAEGHFLLATALEGQGKVAEAIAAYQRASALAESRSPQLAALARIRLGYLLQSGALPTMGPTPTPTPGR